MDDFTIARIVHVVAVLMWIGGVAFVTTVVMPAIRRDRDTTDRLAAFHRIENGFAWQARIWVLLAGASGFWMVWRTDMWSRFADLQFWWMWAMLLVWLFFMVMLFILEPLFLHKRMASSPQPQQDFQRMERVHRILLLASIITTIGAVGGSHGLW
ncbi:MAG: hypothetical protein IPG54_10500 [Sphingomonadales bacterium]|jgi:uncharacterized membrane protein|nr:hypothetical protein [Sphingomonadales bacterium]MBK9004136.1 hypothetical protein [Sphingomonadales bacterium]MBK9269312.1 hypothetical protein [Sphingomonadales bacterium]MBP6434578.1 hypothetical protein [Sphingorhabdus sp.]